MSREFKIHQLFFTENACYKKGRRHTVKGIMWHSTGANNKKLSRYVGPDDGILGVNPNNNHWNQLMSRNVCVHAFIGVDKDGIVRTYQTLPWDMVGWHSGSGSLGSAKNANNNGYVSFEICEDGLNDKKYFDEVYEEAINLSVYLCKEYNLSANDIIDHSEGNKLGIASNHGDVQHWLRRFGKTMSDVRKEVTLRLKGADFMGSVFKDVEDNRWSAEYIKASKDLGIISGNPDGTFNPTGNLTREQAAVINVRLYEIITGKKVVK